MKIIAVNISKTINDIGPEKATQRAWKLNKSNAEKHDFVIGFNKDGIYPFVLINVEQDEEHQNRIKFNLRKCTDDEEKDIEKYLEKEKIKLKYITVRYIPSLAKAKRSRQRGTYLEKLMK